MEDYELTSILIFLPMLFLMFMLVSDILINQPKYLEAERICLQENYSGYEIVLNNIWNPFDFRTFCTGFQNATTINKEINIS